MRRRIPLFAVALLLLVLCVSSGRSSAVPPPVGAGTHLAAAAPPSPTSTVVDEPSTDTFSTPSAVPTAIPTRDDVESCKAQECNGTDPHKTGCDDPEMGAYTQASVEVRDKQGNLLGTLFLRANHTGCESTQWALFSGLTRPLTFELRVVQNHTGLTTEVVRMEDWREDTWTMQLHSPDERIRAEVVVFDQNGKVIASDVTDSY